ncbi:NEW3 domain-containing protein [Rhizobium sp. L1K21]|uniref:NEW3 domain-containing protein n=1 Tax=Rhizobium sp. L1K21 TaxID=2954933 RepID=UPI00209219C1|nr:NEW3 domain-containing protein [Rhizobium sp. L1K21]MCO6188057.1 NEW3 domain-containing protein [Rhizobium sp. L1K21]
MVRFHRMTLAATAAGVLLAGANSSFADNMKPQGLWLTTDYPAITESIGQEATLSINLANSEEPPQRVEFSVRDLPSGWTWELQGSGKPISAAYAMPDDTAHLQLKVTPPKDIKPGQYNFTLQGNTENGTMLTLPIEMTMAEGKPASLSLEAKLPALRGTPKSSFDYDLTIKNESENDTTLNLLANAPDGFQTTFKEQYGNQELASLPLKAGESKTVKLSVKPPADVAAGDYKVAVAAANADMNAKTGLLLQLTGQPNLALSTKDGRLSGQAEAGKEQVFDYTVSNSGSAPAQDIKLSASAPSGWKVEMDPKTIDQLAPGSDQQVAVHMTPTDKAIAGDYMVTVNARGDGLSDSSNFRVTVTTSTLWGIAGLGIIGSALMVLALAVTRYGRR